MTCEVDRAGKVCATGGRPVTAESKVQLHLLHLIVMAVTRKYFDGCPAICRMATWLRKCYRLG